MWALSTLGMLSMSTSKIKRPSAPYHHGDLRRALIAAGLRLLQKRGPAQVSLRETARVAGVSHNAPYRHFENREALLAALATDGFGVLTAAMEQAAEGKERLERLRAIGLAYIAFAKEHPAVYLLMFGPELDKSPFAELTAAAQRSFEILSRAIEALTPKNVRQAAAIGAWALVHGFSHLVADRQLPEELAAQDKLSGLIESALAIYRKGLPRAPGRRH